MCACSLPTLIQHLAFFSTRCNIKIQHNSTEQHQRPARNHMEKNWNPPSRLLLFFTIGSTPDPWKTSQLEVRSRPGRALQHPSSHKISINFFRTKNVRTTTLSDSSPHHPPLDPVQTIATEFRSKISAPLLQNSLHTHRFSTQEWPQ